MKFQKGWLGYELSSSSLEHQPSVQALRDAGIKKPMAQAGLLEVASFSPADLSTLTDLVKRATQARGQSLATTNVLFNGCGATESPKGTEIYFVPDPVSALESFFLQSFLRETPEYVTGKNCKDIFLRVGGPEIFAAARPKQTDVSQPFQLLGTLVFVGDDGKAAHTYYWSDEEQQFLSKDEMEKKRSQPVHTIAIFPKIQADTATAVYLLRSFGEALFPGIAEAKIEFWSAAPEGKSPEQLEKEGCLLIDLGGRFDHHLMNQRSGKRSECAASLIAKYLGVEDHLALQKLLTWAKRDDLQGKGTVSADPIDRAFGLSGIIMNLNRQYHEEPQKALDIIVHLIGVHVAEEYRRHVELPREWEELEAKGKAESFILQQGSAELSTAVVESDNTTLAGFLRAAKKVDLILQRASTGHTNIITRQLRNIDLRPVIAALRLAEAEKKGLKLPASQEQLEAAGRLPEIEAWYYDDAANTIQNGGANPQGVKPTMLSKDEAVAILKDEIPKGRIGSIKYKKASEFEDG